MTVNLPLAVPGAERRPGAAEMGLHVATPMDAGATAAERSGREVSSAAR